LNSLLHSFDNSDVWFF
jgi:hypothetical protein